MMDRESLLPRRQPSNSRVGTVAIFAIGLLLGSLSGWYGHVATSREVGLAEVGVAEPGLVEQNPTYVVHPDYRREYNLAGKKKQAPKKAAAKTQKKQAPAKKPDKKQGSSSGGAAKLDDSEQPEAVLKKAPAVKESPEYKKLKAAKKDQKGKMTEMMDACFQFQHCCQSEKMNQVCDDYMKDGWTKESNWKGSKAPNIKVDFCDAGVSMNIRSALDWALFFVNKLVGGLSAIAEQVASVFSGAVKKVLSQAAKTIVTPDVGKALEEFLLCMEKRKVWQKLVGMMTHLTRKKDKSKKVPPQDMMFPIMNMGIQIDSKHPLPFMCRVSLAFRFGFLPGLFARVSEALPSIMLWRDIALDGGKMGKKLGDSSGFTGLMGRLLARIKFFLVKGLGAMGEVGKKAVDVYNYFKTMVVNLLEDPNVAAALDAITKDKGDGGNDMQNLINMGSAFAQDLVEAVTDHVFGTSIAALYLRCKERSVDKNRPKEEEGLFKKFKDFIGKMPVDVDTDSEAAVGAAINGYVQEMKDKHPDHWEWHARYPFELHESEIADTEHHVNYEEVYLGHKHYATCHRQIHSHKTGYIPYEYPLLDQYKEKAEEWVASGRPLNKDGFDGQDAVVRASIAAAAEAAAP